MTTPAQSWLTFLLTTVLLSGCGKPQEVQVARPEGTAVRAQPLSGADTVEELAFGTRVPVRTPHAWETKGWLRRTQEGQPGFLDPRDVAVLPVQGQAVQLRRRVDVAPGTPETLEFGTAVDVVLSAPWLPPDRAALVREGTLRGFLPADAVSQTAPTAADHVLAAGEAVVANQLDAATAVLDQGLVKEPGHAPSLRLLLAVLQERGDPRAAAVAEQVRALPPPPELPDGVVPPDLKEGQPVYAAVNAVTVRKKAEAGSAKVGTLRFNERAVVLDASGPDLQVALRAGTDVVVDAFETGATTFPGGAALTGSVAREVVDTQPVTQEHLVEWSGRLLAQHQPGAAAVVARRLPLLGPVEGDARAALVRALVAADHVEDLFALLHTQAAPVPEAPPPVEHATGGILDAVLFYGCRGRMEHAQTVDLSGQGQANYSLKSWPRDVCLQGMDVRDECPPHQDDYTPQAECDLRCERELARSFQEAQRRHERVSAELDRLLEHLRTTLPGPGYLRAQVDPSHFQGRKLFAYRVHLDPNWKVEASGHATADYAPTADTVVAEVPLPAQGRVGTFKLWIPVPWDVGLEAGVALAASEDDVKAWLLARQEEHSAELDSLGLRYLLPSGESAAPADADGGSPPDAAQPVDAGVQPRLEFAAGRTRATPACRKP